MASENRKTVCLSFRCDEATHMNLLVMAEREGIALATLCTRLVKQAVGRDGKATLSREHVGEIRSRAKRRMLDAGRTGR